MSTNSRNLIFAAWLITFCLPAFAYVDPVSGAMLLQIIISGIAGVVLVCRRAISNLFRKMIRRVTGKPDQVE